MIEQDARINIKVVGCIITGMSELNKDKLSSDNDNDRAREDSSSDNDTDSFGNDGIYNDGEPWDIRHRP